MTRHTSFPNGASLQYYNDHCIPSPSCVRLFKDNVIKYKVIELAKLRKMLMPSIATRGQQQSRVVKGRAGQLLTPHNIQNVPTYNKEQFLLLLWQKASNLSSDAPSSVP